MESTFVPQEYRVIIDHLSKDPILAPIIEMDSINTYPLRNNDVLTYLLKSIISQQISIKAAAAIYRRFELMVDLEKSKIENLLEAPIEDLRGIGLSKQKINYIKNVVSHFLENDLLWHNWDEVEDEEIIKLLTAIKGVGEWTAQMVLMFALDRSDVFPLNDLGIQQGIMLLYQINPSSKKELKKEMIDISKNWIPFRSYASYAIWHYKNQV